LGQTLFEVETHISKKQDRNIVKSNRFWRKNTVKEVLSQTVLSIHHEQTTLPISITLEKVIILYLKTAKGMQTLILKRDAL
jgi:hypothetical protein